MSTENQQNRGERKERPSTETETGAPSDLFGGIDGLTTKVLLRHVDQLANEFW